MHAALFPFSPRLRLHRFTDRPSQRFSSRVLLATLRRGLAMAACGVTLAGAAPVWAQQPVAPHAAALSSGFRLGPGDVLSVTVWKQPALSLQLPVAPDGTLRYPLAGHLDVQGRTVAEVETALSAKLGEQLREALVTVSLVQVHSFRVYVLGEVLRPGELILRGPVSVVQALAMSNGFTPFARRDKVLVVRQRAGTETREIFDYAAYVRGEAGGLAELETGDVVIVQ